MKLLFKILLITIGVIIGSRPLVSRLILWCNDNKSYAKSFTELKVTLRSRDSNYNIVMVKGVRRFAISPTEMRQIWLHVYKADDDYLQGKINGLKEAAQSQLSKERFVEEEDKEILVWLKENLADTLPAGSEQIAVLNIDDYKSKNVSKRSTIKDKNKRCSREGVFKITMAEDGSVASIRDMSGVGFKTLKYNYDLVERGYNEDYAEGFKKWEVHNRDYNVEKLRLFALSPTEMRLVRLRVNEIEAQTQGTINSLKDSASSKDSEEKFIGERDKEILVWLKENLADSFPAGSEHVAILNVEDYKSKNVSKPSTMEDKNKTCSRRGVFKITMAEDGSVANIRDMSGVGFGTRWRKYNPNSGSEFFIGLALIGILIYALYWIIWGDYNGGGGSGDSGGGTWIVTRIK